ncbi:MAG: Phage/plasmid primase, P4 family [Archaeoglobus fulgidus]|uniref:Phage/plasmid primase, P4 family n=1 Tax=Archaeoglobus fulgidus TaxID=2234 RepID=A0A101DEC4_ARCFL|nr:phage/plasmid primase, P4 family [Archaeoglobus fulgidus]KUJ94011.1 MAG: Phage/plasmid primase, P4 family [Archaeoglobus fulgidus]KUK07041.1 MAG: Phage/plasmid primase, P4 family [Archaeoglobus fulgidus]
MTTKPSEFVKLLERIPQGGEVAFIPIVENGKEPDTPVKIKDNLEKIKLTASEALRRLQRGQNVGIYAFPGGLCFVDVDRPDIVDLSEFPETFTVKTRNGGFQLYYLNTGVERNFILKKDGEKIGELRANWQYVLVPGSHVPPDGEAFDGATGVYEVVRDAEIRPLDFSVVKRFIEEDKKGEEEKAERKVHSSGFTNHFGISLEAILKVDEKLAELLSDLQPAGYPSRSEADMAAIDKLWYWGFDESTIRDILRQYRAYEKTERDDYLDHTIEKAITSFVGERFNPVRKPQLFLKLCKIQEGLSKGAMSGVREENSENKGKIQGDVNDVRDVRVSHYFKAIEVDPFSRYKVYSNVDIPDIHDHSVEITPNGENSNLTPDMEVEISAEFFDEKGKFIAKRLADKIMSQVKFVTLTDTSEVWYYDAKKGIWRPNGEVIIEKLCEEYLGEEANRYRVNEVIGHIQRSTYVDRSIFDRNINLIAVENGVLNLQTGELLPFSPDYYLTVKIPVKYNPEADCPKIKQFLKEILHEEDIPVIFELFGFCLYRRYFIHKAFMFVGSGRNGKSTLINLLKAFLGPWNVSNIPLQSLNDNRFAAAELYGKLANTFADLSNEALTSTGIFKVLTGEDTIDAERKFKNPFKFTNYAKLIFSCNQLPLSYDDTDAFFARWIIINFPNQFLENADRNLIQKLTTEEELSGLLNLALIGLWRLMENGDFSKGISIEEARELYLRMSDPVAAFVMDCIEIDSDSYVPKKDLYTTFLEYCRKNKLPTVSENTFHKRLIRHVNVEDYRPKVGGKRVTAWKGIRLKEPEPEVLEEEGFFVCSRCGTRFLTEEEAVDHIEQAREWPEICQPKQDVEEEVIDLTGFMKGDEP